MLRSEQDEPGPPDRSRPLELVAALNACAHKALGLALERTPYLRSKCMHGTLHERMVEMNDLQRLMVLQRL